MKYRDFVDHIDMDAFYEAIGFDVEYVKGDAEDIGFCPDPWGQHKNGDQTGKLAFNREKKLFNCWVCGGGSLVSFVMGLRDCDPDIASEWLEQFADFSERADDEFLSDIQKILSQLDVKREKEILPYFNERVLDNVSKGERRYGDVMSQWLTGRMISQEVASNWLVGYDPQATKYAPRNSRTGEPIDDPYTGSAIILPHFWKGRLVGWQSRWLDDDRPKWCAKYTNTSDFPKRHTIFNFDGVHGRALPPVIVESVPTALMIESLGWPAVATFGASITPEQLKLLRRFQQGVIISPDNDKPGLEGLVKAVEYLEGFIPISWIDPTEWADGDDLADEAGRLMELRLPGNTEPVRSLIENPLRIS